MEIPGSFFVDSVDYSFNHVISPRPQPREWQQLCREPGISSMHYLLTQFRVMVTYIRLSFFPFHQNLDYDYPVYKSIFEFPVLVSFLFLRTIFFSPNACSQNIDWFLFPSFGFS